VAISSASGRIPRVKLSIERIHFVFAVHVQPNRR
jgi:hypothetical protein